MAVTPLDKRAQKILFDTYWTSKGWRGDGVQTTAPADLSYAMSKGLMFAPLSISHDAMQTALRKAVSALTLEQVTLAFLASLSTRRLDLRSGLASYMIASQTPKHRFISRTTAGAGIWCDTCHGLAADKETDLNVLNFERHKWGGVRHRKPSYQYVDLTALAHALPGTPGAEDHAIFASILKTISTAAKTDRPSSLSKRLADLLPSSANERSALLEILYWAGILVPHEERSNPGDWGPVGMWRGADGYDKAVVAKLFGDISRRTSRTRRT